MKFRFIFSVFITVFCLQSYAQGIFVEAEYFMNKGGWSVDQQFMDQMGSPYLIAHGMGVPVVDATTEIHIPKKGTYNVYVRTFNWTSPWTDKDGPGLFNVKINGKTLQNDLGISGDRWMWQYAGKISLPAGKSVIALSDRTGFDGRCDAIYLTTDKQVELPDDILELKDFRKKNLNLPPPESKMFDFVVAGGGIAGMCAAASAARMGSKVALVNDRPILGGNNSSEIRVHLGGHTEVAPYYGLGRMQREFGHRRQGNAKPAAYYEDDRKKSFIDNEENITLFANYRATEVRMEEGRIAAILIKHIESSEEIWLEAPIFSDCTGDATIAFLGGATCMQGRESRDEYGESLAPEKADSLTMGASIQWYSKECDIPTDFPVFSYGVEFNEDNCEKVTMGEWKWETGMNYDQVSQAERIRDYGMLVAYSNWSYLKNELDDNEKWLNRSLDWVAYIAGKRESRRVLGDHILTQNDIDRNVPYDDASFTATWSIDLHFPDPENTKNFPGNEFKAATVHNHIHPYSVPYRCLYSKEIPNLFMAGRNISVSHVALGTVRVMRTTGMMGEVVGMAAGLCREHSCMPRDIYTSYLPELKVLMKKGLGKHEGDVEEQRFNLSGHLLPRPMAAPYSRLEGDTLTIGNRLIERKFLWNGGNLMTYSLTDKKSGITHKSAELQPDFVIMKNSGKGCDAEYEVMDIQSDEIHGSHQKTIISYTSGGLRIRREFRTYYDVPAIACDNYLMGSLSGVESGREISAADRKNIEFKEDMKSSPVSAVVDRLSLEGLHWHVKTVEFWDVTDWNNNLVAERNIIPYRKNNYRGNLLFARNGVNGNGFFFLKEAPCSSTQLAYAGSDFTVEFGKFSITGMGITPNDIKTDEYTRIYSTVCGVYGAGEVEALKSLRSYQKQTRLHNPSRDEMIMMNTWGDRSQDTKVNETFCLAELEKAARMGITHFQIDDGWQAGKSPNSALAKGSFKNIHDNPDYWKPDPEKYPRGLTPVVERGKELGIEIGLWFNPSIQDDFADWEKDVEAIMNLHNEYGINVFKIDGLTIATKKAEENLRKLFDTVQRRSCNQVVFNLDATASRRGGYFMLYEYGNIFLENRYTDWHLYFPYWTLRNLWQLSKYVPAEKLQVEFLNKWRNADLYGDDPFAPAALPFDYVFATAMAGQPLAWMEASNLPEEAFGISPLINEYRKIAPDFHNGVILPIGDEPSGRSWTGFQSISSGKSGYLLIYRELTSSETGRLETFLPEGTEIILDKIFGHGKESLTCRTGTDGTIDILLPEPNTFVMYNYIIK